MSDKNIMASAKAAIALGKNLKECEALFDIILSPESKQEAIDLGMSKKDVNRSRKDFAKLRRMVSRCVTEKAFIHRDGANKAKDSGVEVFSPITN